MSAIKGSVVTVPVVGWVPLHPPDAVQVSAYFALHCNVAGVPMATLLFMAVSVTTGFVATLLGPINPLTWLLDDCPHAVSVAIAAQLIAHRKGPISIMYRVVRAAFL